MVIRSLYRSMHESTEDLKEDFTAEILLEKLNSNSDKGDFALELRDVINNYLKISQDIIEALEKFSIPSYIEEAIRWVTRDV